jgi:hypothetical protein
MRGLDVLVPTLLPGSNIRALSPGAPSSDLRVDGSTRRHMISSPGEGGRIPVASASLTPPFATATPRSTFRRRECRKISPSREATVGNGEGGRAQLERTCTRTGLEFGCG